MVTGDTAIGATTLFLIIGALGEIAFALWARECARAFDAAPGLSPGTTERNRAERLQATQWVSAYLRGLELLSFLGIAVTSVDWAREHLSRAWQFLPPVAFYFALTLSHGMIRATLERKLRAIETPRADAVSRVARAWLGTLLMFAAYFGAFGASSAALRALVLAAFGEAIAAKAIWVTFPFSLLIGLGFTYWLSPALVRVIFACAPLADAALKELLQDCFRRAELPAPSFWVLDMDRHKAHNAMVAGLRSGRGPFRPALFFTRSLSEQLTRAEFEAVILHEVSHLALRHMARRLYWSVGAIFVAFLCGSVFMYFASPWMVKEWRPVAALIALVFSFWVQLATLRWQVRKQELEADAHAVFAFGADLEALVSALTKITQMNDHPMEKKDPSSYFNPSSAHPTTDFRISALRALRDQREASPSDERRAA